MVRTLDFQSEGRGFQSGLYCCVETRLHIVSHPPGVQMGSDDHNAGG